MYRTFRRTLALAAAVCALSLTATAVAKPTPPKKIDTAVKDAQVFRYKFAPGETNQYSTTMKQALEMEGQGSPMQGMNSASTLKTTVSRKVQSVGPDGTATVVTTYDELDLDISQNGVDIPDDKLDPLEEMLKGVKSNSKLTVRGEPQEVSFDGENPGMKELSESMKSALVGTNPVFPEKGLKVGESWTQKVPMTLAQGALKLTINFNVKYTFLGYAKLADTRVAVFRTDVESTLNDTPAGVGGAKLSMTGNGKGEGYLYFDNAKGRLVKSELEMKQSTDMKVEAPQGPSALKMVQTTTSTMDLRQGKK